MLTEQELTTVAAYDQHAAEWDTAHSEVSDFWQEAMRRFESRLPSGSVLEIGSGGGHAARWLTDAGYDYLGTDVSESLLSLARTRVPGARFELADPYSLTGTYDGLWATASLLHVPRRRMPEALAGIRRVLRPGAVGFISLKSGDGSERISDSEAPGRAFTYWSCAQFAIALEEAGFTITEFWRQSKTGSEASAVAFGDWLCFMIGA